VNRTPRITLTTATVLHALECGIRYGFELVEATGLRAGTVYPILRRLEDGGFVSGAWEPVTISRAERRPPRRYYRLTASGTRLVAEALTRYPIVGATRDHVCGPEPRRT
jgi:PadR family transcriptional regulator, regulatory protein PadR